MDLKDKLSEFLSFSVEQKEISLCIVPSIKLSDYEGFFSNSGYDISHNVPGFLDSINNDRASLLIADNADLKDVYDVAAQYPTGQISFFNKALMKVKWVTPNYKHPRIVLISRELMDSNRRENSILLPVFGLTYQH